MKLILSTLLAIVALTGCAVNQDAYYKAIEARENRLAQQELRIDSAITDMAATGGPEAKGMGIAYFIGKSAGAKSSQQMIAAPKSVSDQILPWLSLLLPETRLLFEAKIRSDSALASKKADNKMITDLVHGREAPIVGDADDVLLYTPQ